MLEKNEKRQKEEKNREQFNRKIALRHQQYTQSTKSRNSIELAWKSLLISPKV